MLREGGLVSIWAVRILRQRSPEVANQIHMNTSWNALPPPYMKSAIIEMHTDSIATQAEGMQQPRCQRRWGLHSCDEHSENTLMLNLEGNRKNT